MRRDASFFVAVIGVILLSAVLSLSIPAEGGTDPASPMFGVTILEEYRNWPVVAPSHRTDKDEIRLIPGNDFVFTRYAP